MFDASTNLALKCQPSFFSVNFLDMDGIINQYTISCFVGKKYPIKTFHGKSEIVYTRLYLNKLESIMRALSDAKSTHRPPGNGESDASIAFWLRKGHSAGKPLPQLAIWEDAKFFVQNWTKKLFFANKDPKTNFDDWMILQKHVLSFKCNDFFKNDQFEGDIIFCHLNTLRPWHNGRHFPDNIFKCILLYEYVWILNTSWLKFVY